MIEDALEAEAEAFAERLAAMLEGALGVAHPVRLTAVDNRLSVRSDDPEGIPLFAEPDGQPFMRLKFKYSCAWDGFGKYLAVHDSEFHVLSAWDNDPLFRYEFVRDVQGQSR